MPFEIIQNGKVIAVSNTIVTIRCGENGTYQETAPETADGFCVKIPQIFDLGDGIIEEAGMDTVYALPGHTLVGTEPEAVYKEITGEDYNK